MRVPAGRAVRVARGKDSRKRSGCLPALASVGSRRGLRGGAGRLARVTVGCSRAPGAQSVPRVMLSAPLLPGVSPLDSPASQGDTAALSDGPRLSVPGRTDYSLVFLPGHDFLVVFQPVALNGSGSQSLRFRGLGVFPPGQC